LVDAKVARLSRGLAACAVLCAVALAPGVAHAQELHPVLLAYKAHVDCPLVGDFQRSVQRRSTRIHFVDEGTHDRELSIFLRRDGDFTIGELRLIEANGTLRQRSVRFATCADAVEGLALIATVSLDPQALLEAPAPVPETPPSSPKPTKPPLARPPRVEPNPPPTPPETSGFELKAGAEFSTYLHALPKPAFGATVFVDGGSGSRHWFAPTFTLASTHVERLGIATGPADPISRANFALTLFTLSACPLRIGGEVVVFRPCAALSGGVLRAWGTETKDPQPATRNYWSWGGVGTLSVRLGEVAEIVGDAGVGVTLIRDTFTFGDCRNGPNAPDCTPAGKTQPLYISTGLGFRLLLP
jgi:hypothetical protein